MKPKYTKLTSLAVLAAAIASPNVAHAAIMITEINSNGVGGDFFEIYNTSSSPVSLDGWRWTDSDKSLP